MKSQHISYALANLVSQSVLYIAKMEEVRKQMEQIQDKWDDVLGQLQTHQAKLYARSVAFDKEET